MAFLHSSKHLPCHHFGHPAGERRAGQGRAGLSDKVLAGSQQGLPSSHLFSQEASFRSQDTAQLLLWKQPFMDSPHITLRHDRGPVFPTTLRNRGCTCVSPAYDTRVLCKKIYILRSSLCWWTVTSIVPIVL